MEQPLITSGQYSVPVDEVAAALLAHVAFRTGVPPAAPAGADARLERERIADRLHDEVLVLLSVARQELREGSPDVAAAVKAVEAAIAAVRAVIVDEHPVTQPGRRLADAIRSLLEPICTPAGLRLDIEVTTERVLAPDVSLLLLSAVRELTLNVIKHAAAEELTVAVRDGPVGILAEVVDDGRGIELTQAAARRAQGHLGLARLEHRVREAGGGVVVASRPGRTAITVGLPAS